MDNNRKVYTIKDIQEMLDISKVSAYKLANSNEFPVIRIGIKYIVPKDSFDDWLNNRN